MLQKSVAKGNSFAMILPTRIRRHDHRIRQGLRRSKNLGLQRAALDRPGMQAHLRGEGQGRQRDRPELIRMLDQTRAGDVVVVSRLDRLARSTRRLLEIAERLRDAEAGLRRPSPTRHRRRGAWCSPSSPASLNLNASSFMNAPVPAAPPPRRAACASAVPKLSCDQIALAQRLIGEGTSARDARKFSISMPQLSIELSPREVGITLKWPLVARTSVCQESFRSKPKSDHRT